MPSGAAMPGPAYFSPTLDLTILEQEEGLFKAQAERVLRDFSRKTHKSFPGRS